MNTRRTLRSAASSSVNAGNKSPKRKHESDNSSNDSVSDNSDSSIDASFVTVVPKNTKSNSKGKQTKNVSSNPVKRKHESDKDDGSSSDSSVGDYLKNPDEIDLSSSFFTSTTVDEKPPDFDSIEKKIFGGIQHLSDDSEDSEYDEIPDKSTEEQEVEIPDIVQTQKDDPPTKINFSQLREYNKKLEEAKACVEKYETSKSITKKTKSENKQDITKLLKLGETKNESQNSIESDFDSDDEEGMDWQEIEGQEKNEDKINIPKEGVQITLELPQVIRKKSKGVDMMTAIKRRINRVKKENQVYIHKVHLLCWIAHGNYVNSILNDTELLAPALSLLPSDKCYPPKHADMSYLEQIVQWYGKLIKLHDNKNDQQIPIKESLEIGISKKTAFSKRDFVLIFIIILRSLGLQCRLVLSLQCLPFRPLASELCSLSTKQTETKGKSDKTKVLNTPHTSKSSNQDNSSKNKSVSLNKSVTKTANKSKNNSKDKTTKLKSADSVLPKTTKSNKKDNKATRSSSRNQTSTNSNKNQLKISQIDGADDEETTKRKIKPSIKIKLKKNLDDSVSSTSGIPLRSSKGKNRLDPDDHDFKSSKKRSSSIKSPKDINGNKNSTDEKMKTRKSSSSSVSKNSPSTSSKKTLSEKLSLNKVKSSPKPESFERPKRISEKLKLNQRKSSPSTSNNTSPKKISEKLKLNKIKSEKTSPKIPPASSNYFNDVKPKLNVTNDIINLIKCDMSEKRIAEHQSKSTKKENSDYDSDYFPDEDEVLEKKPVIKKRKSFNASNSEDEFKFKINTNVKRRIKTKSDIDTRVISSDEELSQDSGKKKKIGNDVWAEVFLEEEEKWISVDLIKGQIHCVSELYSRASQPVSYIIAWNNDLSLKDVTARYCPNWNTVTRKLRVDSAWWQQALRPFYGVKTARDKEEDEDLARQQLDKPLPTTISEYKNHPLYALKRHLLKFEAIYPPDALTLGFVRNEAVYARECVHTLHSREIWVKHAKVVKPAQQPYKIVKARPKYDKLTGNMITDLPLEIFGSWQVEDYVPPTAENGVVPRNAFGNVELFKTCMLPFKTVHLQLPGLNKIARKLRIDCAPAVVGFDFHSGFSHPMFDGYVVCEEFKDVLIEAWEQDQVETAKREQEKYEKRVWGNWRKLIKAVLIRERLKARYDFGPVVDVATTKGKKKSSKGTKVVLKKRKICSDDDNDEWTDVE